MKTTEHPTDNQAQKKTFVVNRRLQLKWKGVWCEKDGTFEASGDELQREDLSSWIKYEWVHELRNGERIIPATTAAKLSTSTKAAPSAISQTVPGELPAPGHVEMIALDRIRPDPTQPRTDFAPEAMQEMVDSIKEKGVLQHIQLRPMSRWRQIVSFVARQWVKRDRKDPSEEWDLNVTNFWRDGIKIAAGELMPEIAVMARLAFEGRISVNLEMPGGWEPTAGALKPLTGERVMPGEEEWLEIVYGERRWRGSQAAGVPAIPAKVTELSDIEAAELQAIENLKRKDLQPLEDAAQCRKLLDTPGGGMARATEITGWKRNTIYGKLQLLKLPQEPREWLQRGDLPASTAERIGRLEGRVQQRAIKAILHAERFDLQEGRKVPSDARCRTMIERIEAEEEKLVRWEQACAAAAEKGIKPLGEKEAQENQTSNANGEPYSFSKYVSGSQRCPQHPSNWSWNKILGKRGGEVPKYLGRDYDGNGHVWMLRADAEAKAKEIGIKLRSGGSGGGSSRGGSSSAQEAAERKRRAAQREKENVGLAEIVAKVQQLGPDRLSSKFWRELASTVAEDCWSDTSRRVSSRRGNGVKGRANETLSKQTAEMDGGAAVGLLAELIVVGMRGSSSWGDGLSKKIARMRAILGLVKPGESAGIEGVDGGSADIRTEERVEMEVAA